MASLCLQPRKYLRYLGWCILGVIGDVSDEQGNVIALDGELIDQGVYHYIVPEGQNILAHAVDPEAIRQRSQVPVHELNSVYCSSGSDLSLTTGHMRKTLTLSLSMTSRMASVLMIVFVTISLSNKTSLSSEFVCPFLQSDHHLTLSQTPNPILETTDVPERCQRKDLGEDSDGTTYPIES